MSFDFPNAQLPRLAALEASYVENDVEDDLKRLFLALFNTMLAADVFDVSVLGAAHLGSFDLVRKAVNIDGLVLLPGDREEASTRYLYRAWKSGDGQGRGLHFLRTYLQVLFPNIGEAIQLWHGKNAPYPTDLRTAEGPSTYLTSRIRINVQGFPNADADRRILNCIVQVVPARFVTDLRYTATSGAGKLRIGMVAAMTQRWNTAGVLDKTLEIQRRIELMMGSTGVGARLFRTHGGAA